MLKSLIVCLIRRSLHQLKLITEHLGTQLYIYIYIYIVRNLYPLQILILLRVSDIKF